MWVVGGGTRWPILSHGLLSLPENHKLLNCKLTDCITAGGGGPRVVVSTAAFHARVRGSVPGLGGLKETKLFLPHPRVKVSIVGSLRDREVACSASDRQGSNFESCVWRTVSSQSSHHPQEVLLAQFSLYVHKGGLKPDSFHFISFVLLRGSRNSWPLACIDRWAFPLFQCWFNVGPASQTTHDIRMPVQNMTVSLTQLNPELMHFYNRSRSSIAIPGRESVNITLLSVHHQEAWRPRSGL